MKGKESIKRLLKNVTDNDKSLYFKCALYTFFAAIYPLFAVALPKYLITELTAEQPNVYAVLLIVGVFFVMTSLFGFLSSHILNGSYSRFCLLRINYGRDTIIKLLRVAYPYTENSKWYEENERAFNATNNNDNGVEGVYHRLFSLPAVVIICLALIVFIGLKSPLILLALFLNVAITTLVAKKAQNYAYAKRADRKKTERRMDYYARTTQDFDYGKDIRLYDIKERILSNFNLEIKGYVKVIDLIKKKEFSLGFLSLLTLLISDAATYGLLIYNVYKGGSLADFSMYLAAVLTLSAHLKKFAEDIAFILQELLYINDLFVFFDTDYGQKGGTLKAPEGHQPLSVEFKDVTFTYPKTEKPVFKKLNLRIEKGEKVALVGINGAGKSTLVKLVMGLYDLDEGEILINGVNIKEYDKKELYSMFAVVFQEINIFAFTVAQNIACALEGFDRERVQQVIERVGLKEKIESLPRGIDHMMKKIIEEDGAELSGGENQKLAIARALYKGGNMVIMDEPTAALDALAEAEIYQNFSQLVEGKTAVYVSHRLASTKFCDRIILLDGNTVAEEGSHSSLMKRKGKYYEMFTVQGKYYQDEKEGA